MSASILRGTALAGVAAACALSLAPAPAAATQLYWSYAGFPSVAACQERALETARYFNLQAVEQTEHEVRGEVGQYAYATIICIPNESGATAVMVVAADGYPETTGVDAAQVRDAIADYVER